MVYISICKWLIQPLVVAYKPSITSHLNTRAQEFTHIESCHFWHFRCVKTAVIDIDIGSVPATHEGCDRLTHSWCSQVHSLPSLRLQWANNLFKSLMIFVKWMFSLGRKYINYAIRRLNHPPTPTHQDNVHFPNWGTEMTPSNESAVIYSFLISSGCSNHISPSIFIHFPHQELLIEIDLSLALRSLFFRIRLDCLHLWCSAGFVNSWNL